jgi:mortality factor 4-like protein 1
MFLQIRQLWESGKYPEWNGKGPGDAYGAEHLCRMLGLSCPIHHILCTSQQQSLTECHSEYAGDGRSNQHGRPISQPFARGDQ